MSFRNIQAESIQQMETASYAGPSIMDTEDPGQQKWNDLDKYIDLLLDKTTEKEAIFVYLNENSNGNPYDLMVTSYTERNLKKYYTLSSKGLTLCEHDSPVENLSLGQWLIERD